MIKLTDKNWETRETSYLKTAGYSEVKNERVWKFSTIPKTQRFVEYIVLSSDRLDIISHKFYGTPDFWWIIAAYNQVIDPLLEPGMRIKIPIFE